MANRDVGIVLYRLIIDISRRCDFSGEGRNAFADLLATYEAASGNVRDRMCFNRLAPVYGFTT